MIFELQQAILTLEDGAIDPNTPLDWSIIGVVVISVVVSVSQGMKKIISWVVDKITAPDHRMADLEREKTERETESRLRLVKLEKDIIDLRAEILSLHQELRDSEVARARTEGELAIIKLQYESHAARLETMGRYDPMGKFIDDGWLDLLNDSAEAQYGVRHVIITDDMDEQIALGHETIPVELLEEYQVPTVAAKMKREQSRLKSSASVRKKEGLPPYTPNQGE